MRVLFVLLLLALVPVCAAETFSADLGEFRRGGLPYRNPPAFRDVSLEASASGLAGVSLSGQAGFGVGLKDFGCARVSVAQSFQTPRREPYRTTGILFEAGVRSFVDLAPDVAIYTEHALVVGLTQFTYPSSRGRPTSKANVLMLGSAHTLGFEYGDFTWRWFLDFGVRTSFPVVAWDDRPTGKLRRRTLWYDSVQWIAFRVGVRLYL